MKEKETTIIERVLTFMKGGEKTKLAKFFKGVGRYLDDQIREIENRIRKAKERIEEKEGGVEEYMLTIDFESIKGIDDREKYIERYVAGYDKLIEKIQEMKMEVEDDFERIKRRKEMKLKVK